MAKSRPTDSGLPRREPMKNLAEAIGARNHRHGDVNHLHKGGQDGHDHTDDGKVIWHADAKFVAPTDDTLVSGNTDVLDWTCGVKVRDAVTGTEHVCDRHDKHDPDPAVRGHYWREITGASITDLDVPSSPSDVEQADPTPPPTVGSAVEPSGVSDTHPAGSGDGSGRPSTLVRPDASERVLAAGMGTLVPDVDVSFAMTHAEESARMAVVAQTAGRMFQALADRRLVDDDDVRTVYRKMRQIAATHALDLHDEGAGS